MKLKTGWMLVVPIPGLRLKGEPRLRGTLRVVEIDRKANSMTLEYGAPRMNRNGKSLGANNGR